MIELNNLTTYTIKILDLLNDITTAHTQKDIELTICSDEQMKDINKQSRNIDKSTDVLSFPLANDFGSNSVPHIPLGSIVINIDKVYEKAKELSHSNDDELFLLYIHGLLHILGFDHEIDNGEMREEEAKLIQEYNLPNSLIIRTQEK